MLTKDKMAEALLAAAMDQIGGLLKTLHLNIIDGQDEVHAVERFKRGLTAVCAAHRIAVDALQDAR